MATGLFKSNARQNLVISPVQWAVFPHGPIYPLWAHLSFHMHIFSFSAHPPFTGTATSLWHILHELQRDGRILPGIGRKSSACYLCQKVLSRWEFMGLP